MKMRTLSPRVSMLRDRLLAKPIATPRRTGRWLMERNKSFLQTNPLCVHCLQKGRVHAAEEVDHVVPLHLGGTDEVENLQGLCIPCHLIKTKAEAALRMGPTP